MRKNFLFSFLALSLTGSAQVMFPGDTNNDGRCTHMDILPIGILYGQEVFPRFFPTLNWQPQPYPPFPGQLPVSGVNFAFADCDGNGLIDSLDLDALALNYDLTQNGSQPPPQPYLLDDTLFTTTMPSLRLRFLQDTVLVGDTAVAVLQFFSPNPLPSNAAALGLAVSLNYNTDNVQDSLTRVYVDSMPGDLMFVASAFAFRDIWRTPSGTIELGAAGKGKNTLSKTRDLAYIIILVDDILRSGETKPFTMSFGEVLVVNNHEQVLSVKLQTDTVILFQPTGAAPEPPGRQLRLRLSPNPAVDILTVESPDAPMERIEVFGLRGERVIAMDAGLQNRFDVPVGLLPPGIWAVAVQTRSGTFWKKFVRLE